MVRSYSFKPLLNDDYNFSGKIKHVHFRAHNWKIFPKPCACTFTSEHFHWFIQLRKETLQHFARFWRLFRSLKWSRSILVPFYVGVSLSVFLFLDFIAIIDCVFNIKTIILLWLTGYQKIITILELRASLVIYHIQRALVVRKIACTHARLWR